MLAGGPWKNRTPQRNLNTYLDNLMTLRLFAEYFHVFGIQRGECGKDIESFAKGNNKL